MDITEKLKRRNYYCPSHGPHPDTYLCHECLKCPHDWVYLKEFIFGRMRRVAKLCLFCGAGIIYRKDKFQTLN